MRLSTCPIEPREAPKIRGTQGDRQGGSPHRAAAGYWLKLMTPATIRHAVLTVLEEPHYRDAAGRVSKSFKASGGCQEALALNLPVGPGFARYRFDSIGCGP